MVSALERIGTLAARRSNGCQPMNRNANPAEAEDPIAMER
jgi:hypothetical protein